MGSAVQVADLFFRVGRVLEYDWSWSIWFYDQPTDRLVLYAGTQYDAASRSCRLVRRVWDAGNWLDAGLPARVGPRCGVEERVAKDRLLGHERRFDGHVLAESASGWIDADLGLGRTRLLVRPQS